MAKPRLVKVRALFYVLQQVMKRGCIGILIHPRAVAEVGLEPTQPQWPKDFKSFVSTIPPFGHSVAGNRLLHPGCFLRCKFTLF